MLAEKIEPAAAAPAARWHADWCVTFGPRVGGGAGGREWQGEQTALGIAGLAGSALQIAEGADLVVVFSGVLTNAPELADGAGLDDAARVVRDVFRARGEETFAALRGPFAALVWDRKTERLLVARDQVGIEPIFYARHGSTWYFSPSPDVLVRRPGISVEPDAVALCEWICGWFPAVEDTSYRDVKRVPPATVLAIAGAEATGRRYWDLWPDIGDPVEWLEEKDLDRFEPLLRRAVDRSLRPGPGAILLSGGLDSIAVAATATGLASDSGHQKLLALSLAFPGTASEQPVQVAAARQLGLDHVVLDFEDAAGARGLLAAAMELTARWPQPMWNIWSPAYQRLAERAAGSDRRVLLTGRGGDEWLTVTPYVLADQLRSGDWGGAWRFIQMRRRSNALAGIGSIARLLWLTAGRSLASAALDAVAPKPWHVRRRRRLLDERPAWVAPDPRIRQTMDERVERWMEPARPRYGFYGRESRTALRHPAVTHDMEETQEFGRRLGLRVLHPFWDVDLVSMLHRVPPRLLMQDGRSKSLVRRRLAAELPGLGLDTQRKSSAAHVFRSLMERDGLTAWKRTGGPSTLARLGVVDPAGVEWGGDPQAAVQAFGGPGRLWTLLNLETWTRERQGATNNVVQAGVR